VQSVSVLIRRQDRVTFVAAVLALAAVLLAVPINKTKQPSHTGSNTDVTAHWVADGNRVEVFAVGFRARSNVVVRVGSQPPTQVRADTAGAVHAEVPFDAGATGRPGISVLVTGRATSGSARALVGAVSPRPTGKGPVDLLPWSVGSALVAVVAAATLRWYRRRRRTRLGENAPPGRAAGPR
jgi:hypothetical protein